MTLDIEYKYSIGDMVSLIRPYWWLNSDPDVTKEPEGENVYEIIAIEYRAGQTVWHQPKDPSYFKKVYKLNSKSGDKNIQWNHEVLEDNLRPAPGMEVHPYTMHIELCDTYGEHLNFGDIVWGDLLNKDWKTSEIVAEHSFSFTGKGPIVGFECTIGQYRILRTRIFYKREFPTADILQSNSDIWNNYLSCIVKTVPENYAEMFITECKKNRYNPFKYDYKGHLKLWLEEVRPGMYDEVQQKYNKRRPSPKPDKEASESKKKKTPSKKSTTKAKVSNLLSGLTDEEKAELLKQLKG